MLLQDFNKTRHVGALDLGRQSHGHVDGGDTGDHAAIGARNPDRMNQRLHADMIDVNVATVSNGLNIRQ